MHVAAGREPSTDRGRSRPDAETHGRLAGLDGLRALACLLVLITHAWQFGPAHPHLGAAGRWLEPTTASGLTLFFTLSGFLLYRPFAVALIDGARLPNCGRYLRNRALRIVPAYLAILLVIAVVLQVAVTSAGFYTSPDFTRGPLSGLGSLSPGVLARNLSLTQSFSPHTLLTGIGPAWSLEVEVVFYLALPLLAAAAARLAGRQGRSRGTIAALLPALLLLELGIVGKFVAIHTGQGYLMEWGPTWHAVFERSFLAQADLFAFGMAAAVLHALVSAGRMRAGRLRGAGAVAGLGIVGFSALHARGQLGDLPYTTAMAFAFSLLVLAVARPVPSGRLRRRSILEAKPVVLLGTISYSVYLWHEPLIFELRRHAWLDRGPLSAFVNPLIAFGVVLIFSIASYRLVEAPALRLKARYRAGSESRSAARPAPPRAALRWAASCRRSRQGSSGTSRSPV